MPTGLLIGAAVVGLGLSAAGTIGGIGAAEKNAEAGQQIAADQMAQSKLQWEKDQAEIKRNQLQAVRNGQIARSMALSNATSQNAGRGSGLQGGEAQVSGYENTNLLGLAQNLQIGEGMFNLNTDISGQRMIQAQAQGEAAMWGGIASLGGSLMNAAGGIGRLGAGFGGSSGINQGVAGGGYVGTNGAVYPGPGKY